MILKLDKPPNPWQRFQSSLSLPNADLSSTGNKGEKLEHYHSAGVHVTNIGGDPGRVDDIVEVQHGHERVHLHEHRQRLADPARRAQDRDLEPRRAALGAARRGPQRRRRALLHLKSHATTPRVSIQGRPKCWNESKQQLPVRVPAG